MVRARTAATALVVLALAGCGGGAKPATTPATMAPAVPRAVRACPDAGPGWHALAPIAAARGVQAAALGSGPPVVLLNESDNDPCPWIPEASTLAGRGFSAIVWRYSDPGDEPRSVAEALALADAARGEGRALMVGASLGGRIVFEAAARRPGAFAGIVSVSGERQIQGYRDIRPAVAKVTTPVLYVGSRGDPYTQGARQPRALRSALRHHARFVLVPGSGHGIALLQSGPGAILRQDIESFLARHR